MLYYYRTVAAACFFGVPNFRFHLLQVIVLSFLIALVLVAIADIDSPYQGDVRVSPAGYQFALETSPTEQTDPRDERNWRATQAARGSSLLWF